MLKEKLILLESLPHIGMKILQNAGDNSIVKKRKVLASFTVTVTTIVF